MTPSQIAKQQMRERADQHAAEQNQARIDASKSAAPTGIVLGAIYDHENETFSSKLVFDATNVAVSFRLPNEQPKNGVGARTWVFDTPQGLRAYVSGYDSMAPDMALSSGGADVAKILTDQYHLRLSSTTGEFSLADLDRVAKYHPGDWVNVIQLPYDKPPSGKPGQIVIDTSPCRRGALCGDLGGYPSGVGQVAPDGSRIDFPGEQWVKK